METSIHKECVCIVTACPLAKNKKKKTDLTISMVLRPKKKKLSFLSFPLSVGGHKNLKFQKKKTKPDSR